MKNDEYKFKKDTFINVPVFKKIGIPTKCLVVHCGSDEEGRRYCFIMPVGSCFECTREDYSSAACHLRMKFDKIDRALECRIRVCDLGSFRMLFSYIGTYPGYLRRMTTKKEYKILIHDSEQTYLERYSIPRNAIIRFREEDLAELVEADEPNKKSLKNDMKIKFSNKLKPKNDPFPMLSVGNVEKKAAFQLEKYGRGSIIHMDNLIPDLIKDENDMTSFIVLENDAAKETMTVIPTETCIIEEYFESEDDEEPLLRDPNMIQLIVEHLNRGLQNGRYRNCTLRLPTKEELQLAHEMARKSDRNDYLIASVVHDGDRARAYDLEDWSEIDLLPDCEIPTIKPVLTLPYTLVQYLLITKKKQKHIPAFLFDQYTKNYFTEIQLTAYQYIEKGYTVCPRCHSWNCECDYYH